MMKTSARRAWAWLLRRSALVLLVVTASGLAAGGLAHLAGAGTVADAAWLATAACGLGYALWSAADSIRRGRLGVDVIALLALAGAVAVRRAARGGGDQRHAHQRALAGGMGGRACPA